MGAFVENGLVALSVLKGLPNVDQIMRFQKQIRDAYYKECPWACSRNGQKIKDFRGAWGKACKAARVEGRLFHDLRRTAVRNMVRVGIPERVAMEISGYRTRAGFERYNIVNEDDLRKAAKKLSEYHLKETVTICESQPT